MKFTTPVSMPCTKEQFEELKPLLEAMGYIEWPIDHNQYGYIGTNYNSNKKDFGYVEEPNRFNRIVLPTYHRDLFLALAAMTDEPNGIAGEWWKCVDNTGGTNHFNIGSIYKSIDVSNGVDLIDNEGEKNGWYGMHLQRFTKATVAEIFAHFGVNYGKEQSEPIQPEIPQPKHMLELKQIDENTIEYNGKLFKHTGEDVVSQLVQNVRDSITDYTALSGSEQYDAVLTNKCYSIQDILDSGVLVTTSPLCRDLVSKLKEMQKTEQINKYPWQKEFEILCFQSVVDKTIEYSIDEDKTYGNNSIRAMIEVGSCYNSGAFIIKSIKRLSDNVTFTVGDSVQFKQEPAREIKSLKISEHEGTILANDSKGDMNLMHFNPYKLPTLVDVYDKVKILQNLSNEIADDIDKIK